MLVKRLALPGVYELTPTKHSDQRGFFSETYSYKALTEVGIDLKFVQDNHAYSASKGVLRGLHYQLLPHAQDKLVRVSRGCILDVVVDVRKSSPTFGQWLSLEISSDKGNQILVPKGYAHGLLTLEDSTEVLYKVSNYYSKECDRSIFFDDPSLGIAWPGLDSGFIASEKDRNAPLLKDAEVFP